jgi:hypothetical protein
MVGSEKVVEHLPTNISTAKNGAHTLQNITQKH